MRRHQQPCYQSYDDDGDYDDQQSFDSRAVYQSIGKTVVLLLLAWWSFCETCASPSSELVAKAAGADAAPHYPSFVSICH